MIAGGGIGGLIIVLVALFFGIDPGCSVASRAVELRTSLSRRRPPPQTVR